MLHHTVLLYYTIVVSKIRCICTVNRKSSPWFWLLLFVLSNRIQSSLINITVSTSSYLLYCNLFQRNNHVSRGIYVRSIYEYSIICTCSEYMNCLCWRRKLLDGLRIIIREFQYQLHNSINKIIINRFEKINKIT